MHLHVCALVSSNFHCIFKNGNRGEEESRNEGILRNWNGREEESRNGGIISSVSSRISDSTSAIGDFGRWLISSSNPNFQDHSDENDVKVSEEMSRRNTRDFEREFARSDRAGASESEDSMINNIFKGGRKFFSGSNSIRLLYEALVGVSSCAIGQEFDDPTIGKIELNASYYCDYRCGK